MFVPNVWISMESAESTAGPLFVKANTIIGMQELLTEDGGFKLTVLYTSSGAILYTSDRQEVVGQALSRASEATMGQARSMGLIPDERVADNKPEGD